MSNRLLQILSQTKLQSMQAALPSVFSSQLQLSPSFSTVKKIPLLSLSLLFGLVYTFNSSATRIAFNSKHTQLLATLTTTIDSSLNTIISCLTGLLASPLPHPTVDFHISAEWFSLVPSQIMSFLGLKLPLLFLFKVKAKIHALSYKA